MSTGLLVAEEKLEEIQYFVLRLQRQLSSIQDGFTVVHNFAEYDLIIWLDNMICWQMQMQYNK